MRFPWLDCGGFSTHDARHGIKHTREVTEQLTDAVNRQTSTIDHIVSLPTVNDAFFRMETEQAEWLITDTLHKLFNSKYTVKELLEEFLEDVKQIVLN
ncbi:T7SS effector LXG polymorphic toxin [Bacillus atrophaeus]|uniref:T7SS effector LXG polymorphic toxin n=1 Tax=Bacillus atrophaeus TaxID=1452 RepID=UPI00359C80D7